MVGGKKEKREGQKVLELAGVGEQMHCPRMQAQVLGLSNRQLQRGLSCWAQFSTISPMTQGFPVAEGGSGSLHVASPHTQKPLILLEERICPGGKPPRPAVATPR